MTLEEFDQLNQWEHHGCQPQGHGILFQPDGGKPKGIGQEGNLHHQRRKSQRSQCRQIQGFVLAPRVKMLFL